MSLMSDQGSIRDCMYNMNPNSSREWNTELIRLIRETRSISPSLLIDLSYEHFQAPSYYE